MHDNNKVATEKHTNMFYCCSPIEIKKSGGWGVGKIQSHPNGAWVQIINNKVAHLIADDGDKLVGWEPVVGKRNVFVKI